MTTPVPDLALNNGQTIPQLGFGVFQIDPDETSDAVQEALKVGYRHIDTAEMYQNEAGVGEGIRASGIDRSEIFVTSKLNNGFHEPDLARVAFDETLEKLGFDYVDLFLIHWPLPTLYGGDFVSTWKVLEEFYADGRARSIGVSNFQVQHLGRLAAEATVTPAVNQIEVHPYFTNDEVRGVLRRARHRRRGLVADRPGWRAGRPHHQDHRRTGREVHGPGHPALAPAARRHHLPEVDHPVPDRRELRALRLRAHR